MVTIDEGNALGKALNDPGASAMVGETLRELWTGADSGQRNADKGKRRRVRRREYTFALVCGFVLSVAAKLFSGDSLTLGTPQRFLLVWCGAPDLPDEPVADPGEITVKVPAPVGTGPTLTLCAELIAEIQAQLRARLRTGGTDDETESHRIAQHVRIAVALAIIDGRTVADETDWELAATMLDTSAAVAAYALSSQRNRQNKAKRAERSEKLAYDMEAAEARRTPEGQVRARLLGYLAEAGGSAKWNGVGGLHRRFNGKQYQLARAVRDALATEGKIAVTQVGRSEYVTQLT